MGMRSPGPVGSAAVVLLAVAYAHVLLDLAGAVLAIAIAVRLLGRPVREAIGDRIRAGRWRWEREPRLGSDSRLCRARRSPRQFSGNDSEGGGDDRDQHQPRARD
jgi:hypothetical protein